MLDQRSGAALEFRESEREIGSEQHCFFCLGEYYFYLGVYIVLITQLVEREKDRTMVAAVCNLPDCKFSLKLYQKPELERLRKFWWWVGQQIDYWQYCQLGTKPDPSQDPCQHPSLPPADAEWLRVFSEYYFQILRLLIADPTQPTTGFSVIQDWAESQKRPFPFNHPRELFIEICRDHANSGWEISLEGSPSKEVIKKDLRCEKQLFKGRLEAEQEKETLQRWAKESWSVAWIPAIYNERNNRKTLYPYWEKVDKAHDRLVEFICRKPSKHAEQDVKLIFLGRDRGGRAIDPETKQRVFW